jgi:hypothetical protein
MNGQALVVRLRSTTPIKPHTAATKASPAPSGSEYEVWPRLRSPSPSTDARRAETPRVSARSDGRAFVATGNGYLASTAAGDRDVTTDCKTVDPPRVGGVGGRGRKIHPAHGPKSSMIMNRSAERTASGVLWASEQRSLFHQSLASVLTS